jgi:glycosyltransferase involved in cell wall biosynthesis
MRKLLIISSAPAHLKNGKPFLDKKFIEGMQFYSTAWEGPVACILRESGNAFAFGQVFDVDQLPFEVTILPKGSRIEAEALQGADVILCSGDNHEYLHLADVCKKSAQTLVYTIEYILETRRQIVFLDRAKSLPKKIYSFLWNVKQERRRKKAFRAAAGLQANGYPASAAYTPINANTVRYLDNRVGSDLMATSGEIAARANRLNDDAPIRLVHSGRLETMKGSHDLIPIALRLKEKGINFELNIFGTGSLETEIQKDIEQHGLQDNVKLNGAVDFETELVPFSREHADIYLSCHRQSDPSCSYIENMGCGLAVAGYSNRMWSALCADSHAGWVVPLGDTAALADAIAQAAADRSDLITRGTNALEFAQAHSFEHEFKRRINHLAALP